jgi:hypothetical protein
MSNSSHIGLARPVSMGVRVERGPRGGLQRNLAVAGSVMADTLR